MSFLLKTTAGKDAGSEFTLHDGKNMVGRSRSADVRVFNEDVSGKHFSIDIKDGVATLQNISGYGTRVDGVLVHQTMELQSGQVIEAGKTLKFIFVEDGEQTAPGFEPELTEATKFVGDVQGETSGAATETSENTSVTKFVSDTPEEAPRDAMEETSVTKFVSDIPEEAPRDLMEETSVTKFVSDVSEDEHETPEPIEQTSVTKFADTVIEERAQDTSVSSNATEPGTVISPAANDTFADKTGIFSEATRIETNFSDDATRLENDTRNPFMLPPRDEENETAAPGSVNPLEEHGMYFADEEIDEADRTSSNETQVVQTRMASADEINFIKAQIKKQQQSRLFFKFLLFSLFVVLLGVIWVLRAPVQEKVLSWPQKQVGSQIEFLTRRFSPFDRSFDNGGFDIYFPDWKKAQVLNAGPDTIEIRTYLGKNGDVPLYITVQREISDEFVYENRVKALENMLRRLSERKNEQFNFDSTPATEFLSPEYGETENGILVDKLAYQRDTGNSFFGILRFFRYERTNYIIRAEVPAEEKLRALPVLNTDSFVAIHPSFIKHHWEGHDEYTKGNLARIMVGIKDELQRNSPMQYPRLEREIKCVLAQATYEKNKAVYNDARSLLALLRTRQQQWYNGQKIRWFSAMRENDTAEKMKIRNDCEAVFSVAGDKRRYDILRDHWE